MKFLFLVLIPFLCFAKDEQLEVVTTGSDVVWGFDFLNNGKIIYTQRDGTLAVFDPKTKKTDKLQGVPKVYAVGQGGLLDVRVHPKNGRIYLSYSEPLEGGKSTTAIGVGVLSGNTLSDFKKLFSANHVSENDYHYGSRIEFDGKGHIFFTVGERGERPSVQKLSTHLGKVIRLNEDGSVPKDNPYVGVKDALPEIWARGIRSPQGLAMRPGTEELWEAEMGPKGGDEINMIEPKKDYGWPVVTYGREYDGPKIGEGTSKAGVEEPVKYWVPSISPSALAFHKGELFLATLSGEHVRRIVLNGKKVASEEELFSGKGHRFRNLRSGPDGFLWFSTDEGKIGKIIPKK